MLSDAIINTYGYKEGLTIVDGVVVGWPYQEVQPTEDELTALESTYKENRIKADKIQQIKDEAHKRIVANYPEYKQRNMLADSIEAVSQYNISRELNPNYTMSADDKVMIAQYQAVLSYTRGIRTKSNEIEATLDAMTYEQLKAFDPTDDAHWS